MRSKVLFAMVVFGLASPAALAVPYASAVTDLGGGDYSFVLNQDADSVVINRIGDTPVDMGALAKGMHTFNIGAGTGFEIWVTNSEAVGYTQISNDADITSMYYSPRGVAVNWNPASGYFGWIYVNNATAGVTGTGRTTGDGLYVMTADQADVTGQGDTAYDGGIDWVTGGSSSGFKLTIGPDDQVYITDWSDAHSGLWRAPADLTGTYPNVLANDNRDAAGLCDNHGSIPSVWVEGTGEDTTLYTLDEDLDMGGTTGSVLRYDVGTATNYTGMPVEQTQDGTNIILNLLADVVRDEDGSWWIAQYRYTETEGAPSLTRFEDGGTAPVYNSAADPNLPLLYCTYGNMDIHNGQDRLVLGARSGYGVYIIDISDPDHPALLETLPQSGYAQDVAFDIVGNVYVVSSSSETLRIWSPGGNWVAVTGSDGTFTLTPGAQCPGDVDGDGDTDLNDLAALLAAYGSFVGDPNYNPAADFDGDGDVDLTDLAFLLSDYGCLP
jgi:hypothetical protein